MIEGHTLVQVGWIVIVIDYKFLLGDERRRLTKKERKDIEIRELAKLIQNLVYIFWEDKIDAVISDAVIQLGGDLDILLDIWTFSDNALKVVETIRTEPVVAKTQTFQVVHMWTMGEPLKGVTANNQLSLPL